MTESCADRKRHVTDLARFEEAQRMESATIIGGVSRRFLRRTSGLVGGIAQADVGLKRLRAFHVICLRRAACPFASFPYCQPPPRAL